MWRTAVSFLLALVVCGSVRTLADQSKSPSAQDANEEPIVIGRVIDKSTGKPWSGRTIFLIRVHFHDDTFSVLSSHFALTDKDGKWKIPAKKLAEGNYLVSISPSPSVVTNATTKLPTGKKITDLGDLEDHSKLYKNPPIKKKKP